MTVAKPRLAGREPVHRRRVSPGPVGWSAALCAGLVTGLLLRVRSTPDVDLWLHLRIGELLLSGERFDGQSDPLALFANRQYVPSQWLSQVGMFALYEVAGMTGIQSLRLLLVLSLGVAVLLGCRTAAGPAPALFATAMAMFGAGAAWGERPQLAGVFLLATTVAVWWRASVRGVVPWTVIPLTWLWAMVHGSWVLGVAVGTALLLGGVLDRSWAGRTAKLVSVVPLASIAVALLTPLGVAALLEPFRVSSVARLTANEWQTPAPGNPLLLVVLASAVIALLGVVRSRQRRWTHAITVIFSVAMAVWMVRTIAIGAVILAPALAHGLSTLRPGSRRVAMRRATGRAREDEAITAFREWPLWTLAAALVLALGGSHLATTNFKAPVSARVSTALEALPSNAVLAVDGKAVGWVQWAHQDRRPLRDLRAEVYSLPVATAYEDFQEARTGWQDYAKSEGVTALLADRERPLDRALTRESGWLNVAEDGNFRLWVRR